MKARQALRWERTRQVGRRKFILYYGVLGMGLIGGMLYSIIDLLRHNEPFSWGGFMVPLIVFPLGGIWWGSWMWKRSESEYGEYMKNALAKEDGQGG